MRDTSAKATACTHLTATQRSTHHDLTASCKGHALVQCGCCSVFTGPVTPADDAAQAVAVGVRCLCSESDSEPESENAGVVT